MARAIPGVLGYSAPADDMETQEASDQVLPMVVDPDGRYRLDNSEGSRTIRLPLFHSSFPGYSNDLDVSHCGVALVASAKENIGEGKSAWGPGAVSCGLARSHSWRKGTGLEIEPPEGNGSFCRSCIEKSLFAEIQ